MTENVAQLLEASRQLKPEEQIELFEALWDMIDEHSEPEDFELTPETRELLRRRWEEHQQNPESAIGWEEGKARLAAMRARP